MTVITENAAFDRAVRPVLSAVLTDKATDFLERPPDADLARRIDELACKSTEGALTPEERAEYESYVRANKFLAILRKQARHLAAPES